MKLKQKINFIMVCSMMILLSGCSSYKSSFNCGDAKGAYCASMDYVDQMINSGEIESFNEKRVNKKHKLTDKNILPTKTKVNPTEIISYEDRDVRY
jgi:uncharacterized protein YceK